MKWIMWALLLLMFLSCWHWLAMRRATPNTAATPDAPMNKPSAVDARPRIPGRRTILLASAVAAASLSADWVDFLMLNRTGFQMGLSLLLWLWLYPFATAFLRWRLWPRLASLCLGLSTLSGLLIWYRVSHTKVFIFTVDASGAGIACYLGATVALWIGLRRYARVHSS